MMYKVPNRANMIAQFFRERQGFTNQVSDPLSQSVIEPFNIAGFIRFFAHCSMSLAR
jgi:hypothetical protein